jgi:protein tyrosine phosphatase (PTP) superfamily phosphohydrolase (DUF442 family)
MVRITIAISLLLLAFVQRATQADPPTTSIDGRRSATTPLDSAVLPNAYRLTDKVISGGQPEGEAGFAELRSLGVKTIVSVDGARPDVATARKYGLRYVHLPHGYDGIPQERMRELAKAVRDLPGPIYIHCHHGKHRSPAAAAAACVVTGDLKADQALEVLKTAGTSPNYRGLFASVQAARPIAADELDNLNVKFHETEKLPPLADAMIAVEHHHDHLKAIAAADWKTPPDHPDLDPPHEALLLAEQFSELLRTDAVQGHPAEFAKLLRDGEQAAYELELSLRTDPRDAERNNGAFATISANCQACHQQFRDVPLGEKATNTPKCH